MSDLWMPYILTDFNGQNPVSYTHLYLQEMKATIDAMYDFVNQYVCSQEK